MKTKDKYGIDINCSNCARQCKNPSNKCDTANIFSKPVDEGYYTFMDKDFKVLKEINDYVPKGLDIDDDGYGDYITLTIMKNGMIKDWKPMVILEAFYENEG